MVVYVDNTRNKFKHMIMSHMWADTDEELHAMATKVGLKRVWFQRPPHAKWKHYDLCQEKKCMAIRLGAIETDKYGASEYIAQKEQNYEVLQRITKLRQRNLEQRLGKCK